MITLAAHAVPAPLLVAANTCDSASKGFSGRRSKLSPGTRQSVNAWELMPRSAPQTTISGSCCSNTPVMGGTLLIAAWMQPPTPVMGTTLRGILSHLLEFPSSIESHCPQPTLYFPSCFLFTPLFLHPYSMVYLPGKLLVWTS